ncbi:hypothetical protein [Pelagicoccus mobilis]|uniref:Uncharacterized protein n=1 Tax=Pelagicoccus mobilis TaxID=415221 RepID=A0A934RVH7_9BACT|nr:hypothetical protein [Pelagicoccus mobilis]MBK1877226.1 hypothetical protein [Pelagicoccus mobilis]
MHEDASPLEQIDSPVAAAPLAERQPELDGASTLMVKFLAIKHEIQEYLTAIDGSHLSSTFGLEVRE